MQNESAVHYLAPVLAFLGRPSDIGEGATSLVPLSAVEGASVIGLPWTGRGITAEGASRKEAHHKSAARLQCIQPLLYCFGHTLITCLPGKSRHTAIEAMVRRGEGEQDCSFGSYLSSYKIIYSNRQYRQSISSCHQRTKNELTSLSRNVRARLSPFGFRC